MYEVILTWEAMYDITDITEYIEIQFGKERSDRFQGDIRNQIFRISGWYLRKNIYNYQESVCL